MRTFPAVPILSRRALVASGSALALSGLLPRRAGASARDPRLVVVILRGALDGLAVLPPLGDPAYAAQRGDLALPVSGDGAALALDGFFGLNPNMPGLKALYDEGHALMLHAVASPYRERSHFDGQDALENGTARPRGAETGWLNRAAAALAAAGAAEPVRGPVAFAAGPTVPLILRGPAPVVNWSPGGLRAPLDDTLGRLDRLYDGRDPALHAALEAGRQLDAALGRGSAGSGGIFAALAGAAGRALARPDGPRLAALSLDGWDTHAAEGPATGRLAHLLRGLDGALAALRGELGSAWGQTVVAVVTEFGRTVRVNGSEGTDHGTAAAAFLAGGAVAGGRVRADWPGLAPNNLFEGRDLRPTGDLRALFKGLLRDHLGLPETVLARTVFPGSEGLAGLRDLVA